MYADSCNPTIVTIYPLTSHSAHSTHSVHMRAGSLHNCNGLCDGRQVNFTLQTPTPAPVASLLRRAYFAATTFMDDQIGRVLKALDDSGYEYNALLSAPHRPATSCVYADVNNCAVAIFK